MYWLIRPVQGRLRGELSEQAWVRGHLHPHSCQSCGHWQLLHRLGRWCPLVPCE